MSLPNTCCGIAFSSRSEFETHFNQLHPRADIDTDRYVPIGHGRLRQQRWDPAEGRKDDTGKAPWSLLPFDALGQIVAVLRFGAGKYSARNWEKGMAWDRPFDACIRHLTSWHQGEAIDPETGFSHLAHAGCCVLFLLAYELRSIGKDTRPKLDKPA